MGADLPHPQLPGKLSFAFLYSWSGLETLSEWFLVKKKEQKPPQQCSDTVFFGGGGVIWWKNETLYLIKKQRRSLQTKKTKSNELFQ